ncbi:hypothetical protein SH139x_002595 [Planctomycetaceae bacterium SH139]
MTKYSRSPPFFEDGVVTPRIAPAAEVIDETELSIVFFAWNNHFFVVARVAFTCSIDAARECGGGPRDR